MATTPQNRIVREVSLGSVFEDATQVIDATVNINQGDLCWLDTSAHLIKSFTTVATQSQTFLGISDVTIVNGKPQQPYTTAVSASVGQSALPGPKYGVVASLYLVTGQSISPGQLVYPSFTDAQTVTASTASGDAIGVYQGKALTSVPSGTTIEVLLGHRYPVNVLVM